MRRGGTSCAPTSRRCSRGRRSRACRCCSRRRRRERGSTRCEAALAALDVEAADGSGHARLAIDRAFAVRGRGTVVTGSLRGGRVAPGDTLRLVPGDRDVRIREVQVRSATVDAATGGRTALLLGGIEAGDIERGAVLTADPDVAATSRLLVSLRRPAGLAARATPESPLTAIGSGCTSGPTRSTRSSSVARASRSTSRMGACSRSSASPGRSRPRPATGSRSGNRHPARPRVAAWSSTRSRRAGSRAGV